MSDAPRITDTKLRLIRRRRVCGYISIQHGALFDLLKQNL